MEPAWGPSDADRSLVGPMLAPWTSLSGLATASNVKENHKLYCGALFWQGQIDTDSNNSLTCNTDLLAYGWQNGVGLGFKHVQCN